MNKAGELPPLWTCPRCGHQFVTRNLWHSCGRYSIDDHFRGKDPVLRRTFDRLVEVTRACVPLSVYAQKTRIVFMVRVRFAGVAVRKQSLDFRLWLTREVEHPLLQSVETFGLASFGIHFKVIKPEDVDEALQEIIAEAYKTGKQEHLGHRATGTG